MVSSNVVTSTSNSVKTGVESYKKSISSLSSSWKGTSASSIIGKVDTIDEYVTSITSAANSFASACDKYEEYVKVKKKIEDLKSDLASAKKRVASLENNKLSPNYESIRYAAVNHVNILESSIEKYEEKKEKLKQQINKLLSEARSSVKSYSKSSSKPKAKAKATTNAMKMTDSKFSSGDIGGVPAEYLKYSEKDIENVLGKQQSGDSCGVYAMAYGWNILEGKNRVSGNPASESDVKRAYNDGTSYCQWYNMNSTTYGSSRERYNKIWEEVVEKKKPVVAATQGYYADNHYVTVVGVRQGATKENLSQKDLVVMNSAGSGSVTQMYTDDRDFDGSGYKLQLITFNDK